LFKKGTRQTKRTKKNIMKRLTGEDQKKEAVREKALRGRSEVKRPPNPAEKERHKKKTSRDCKAS